MKFPYKSLSRNIVRPIIPIEIRNGSQSISYAVLVDSGADMNLLPAEIGELIGLDIKKGIERTVGGVTGHQQTYFAHSVVMKVGGWFYQVEMGFLPDMRMPYGVVGQAGFFDQFKSVSFNRNNEEIELKAVS